MSEANEDKRISGRRKQPRRISDFLGDKLSEEEKREYDRVMYSKFWDEDRRARPRRSGTDRREVEEGG